jgi:glycosyltransferase involved in cell wall biosynthesis
MSMNRKLRIAIDCRITNSQQGVGTAVITLAKALSDSKAADQEYTFIVCENMQHWLAPYVYGPCRLVGIPASRFSTIKAALRWIAPLRFIWENLRRTIPHVPVSDGYVESQHFDVVHFPTQAAYLTALPSIFQPQDLQHLHYPQFFSKTEFILRERYYRAFCGRASCVCVQAEWTRQDVINHYGLPEDKVVVVPWGSVFDAYIAPSPKAALAATKKYGLPDRFFFYPAVTWPHKNHEAILRALHILKTEHSTTPHVYFTGSSTEHRTTLDKLAQDLDVFEQTHFLGFLPPEELQAIFSVATAMLFPSKFEGFGLPILEAFHAQLPVLSSNATTLPEIAGDAALYFDPDSPSELAALMKTILEISELRQDLIKKGTLRLSQYSINDTAADFQSLYERTAVSSSQERDPSSVSAAI